MVNHSDINKNFIPYELAVKLKELGFDEPCFYYFNKSENNQLWQNFDSGFYRNTNVSKSNLLWGETYDNGNIAAPLWQQAARFLNINSNNQINITINGKDDYEALCKKFEKAIKNLRYLQNHKPLW